MSDSSEVREWLASLKLDRYYTQFIENGYDDVVSLQNLTDEDLDAIGVTLAGHRKRLIAKSNGYAGVNFSTGLLTPETQKKDTSKPPPAPPPAPPPLDDSQTKQPSPDIDLASLDDVLDELTALSHVPVEQPAGSHQYAGPDNFSPTSDADVDLDKLLSDLSDFNPREAVKSSHSEIMPVSPVAFSQLQDNKPSIQPKPSSLPPPEAPPVEIDIELEMKEQEALAATQVIAQPKTIELSGNPVLLKNAKETQASTVEIKERLAAIRIQLDQTDMSESEKECELREARMRIAMEKIKEASVQQAIIDIYTEDGCPHTVVVQEGMTASAVCFLTVSKSQDDELKCWILVERLTEMHLERTLEDHEIVLDVYFSWPRSSSNQFILREEPLKYDIFDHPVRYFPAHLAMKAGEMQTGSKKAERAKAILLKEFFTSSGRVPELEGNIFFKEPDKKAWKKAFFMLRSSGLYYSTKGKSRESRHLVCFVKFEGHSLYAGENFKKEFKSPTEFTLALKPANQQVFNKETRCLCTEDSESLSSWMAGIRLAKFGPLLRENYQASQRKTAKLKEIQRKKSEGDVSVAKVAKAQPPVNAASHFPFPVPSPSSPRRKPEEVQVPPSEGVNNSSGMAGNASLTAAAPPPAPPLPNRNVEMPPWPSRRPSPRASKRLKPKVGPLDHHWYHGPISRDETIAKFAQNGNYEGLFLVRDSSRKDGSFVLSMMCEGKPLHFQIQPVKIDASVVNYSIDDGPLFPGVAELISHYSMYADRLPCKLAKGITRPMYRKTEM